MPERTRKEKISQLAKVFQSTVRLGIVDGVMPRDVPAGLDALRQEVQRRKDLKRLAGEQRENLADNGAERWREIVEKATSEQLQELITTFDTLGLIQDQTTAHAHRMQEEMEGIESAKVASLEQAMTTLQEELVEAKATVESFQDAEREAVHVKKAQDEADALLRQKMERLETDNGRLEAEKRKLEESDEEKSGKLLSLESTSDLLKKKNSEYEELSEGYTLLERKEKARRDANASLKSEIEELRTRAETAESAQATLQNSNRALQAAAVNLPTALKPLEDEIALLRGAEHKLKEEKAAASAETERLREELQASQQKCTTAEREGQTKIATLEGQVSGLKTDISGLQAEKKSLGEKVDSAQTAYRNSLNRNIELSKQIVSLQEEISGLKTEKTQQASESKSEIGRLEEELSNLHEENWRECLRAADKTGQAIQDREQEIAELREEKDSLVQDYERALAKALTMPRARTIYWDAKLRSEARATFKWKCSAHRAWQETRLAKQREKRAKMSDKLSEDLLVFEIDRKRAADVEVNRAAYALGSIARTLKIVVASHRERERRTKAQLQELNEEFKEASRQNTGNMLWAYNVIIDAYERLGTPLPEGLARLRAPRSE